LDVFFQANRVGGIAPQSIIFTATVSGANTNNLGFAWDFKSSQTQSGPTLFVVTNTYAVGEYLLPLLTVTNGIGESITRALAFPSTDAIRISPPQIYVSLLGGSNQAPYDTPEKATPSIQSAVDQGYGDSATGTVVWVADGTYPLSAQVNITKGVTVRSVNGPNAVILNGGGTVRAFNVSHAGAVIDGFTITNGYHVDNGGGVYMTDGTLRNCIITGNRCYGGNTDTTTYGGGGVALNGVTGGIMRNCLIAGNHVDERSPTGNSAGGGGIWVKNGTWRIENCTIVRNFAGADGRSGKEGGGGVFRAGGTVTVTNSIVYYNRVGRSDYHNIGPPNFTTLAYSCTTNPVVAGTGNITAEPGFKNSGSGDGNTWSGGNLQLASGSPCIDKGAFQTWMTADARDLAGGERIVRGTVDMGAFESPPAGTLILLR